MNYRSVANLNLNIREWIVNLPQDFDIIVGIPRSGLLVANLLALYLNLPLTDVRGLCEGKVLYSGPRIKAREINLQKIKKVLIVDDSICSGTQMLNVKKDIYMANLSCEIFYGAVYIVPKAIKQVDFWYEIVDIPRVFEWNLMHHNILSNSCVDIDGVLCRDPTNQENDDGHRYKEFLMNVKSLIIPTKPIGWLVTCRLEKYRKVTEIWLKRQGIQYQHLIMMDFPDKKARIASGSHALFKAKAYKSLDAVLFIESSLVQAKEIAKITNKPVFCTEANRMINSTFLIYAVNNPIKVLIKLKKFIKREVGNSKFTFFIKKFVKNIRCSLFNF